MKIVTGIAFLLWAFCSRGQVNLSEIDTTVDFRSRFYKDGKLITTNQYYFVDSVQGLSEQFVRALRRDTTNMERVQHGLWIEYFDKNWQPCDSSHHRFYRLAEYGLGYHMGKIYCFNKNNQLVRTALRYPKINDSTFKGVRYVDYQKGNIIRIRYHRFTEDSLKGFYLNWTTYFPDGRIKYYMFDDDFNNNHISLEYDKKGLCYYESKQNAKEWYTIKRKRRGRKEIITTKENGEFIKIVKIEGKEVRRRNIH